jgi:hypothetical protein
MPRIGGLKKIRRESVEDCSIPSMDSAGSMDCAGLVRLFLIAHQERGFQIAANNRKNLPNRMCECFVSGLDFSRADQGLIEISALAAAGGR